MVKQIRKRDGKVETFQPEKITWAIFKAAQAVGGNDFSMAEQLCRPGGKYYQSVGPGYP